jgi:multiple sugar transport system substrate-binding protein/putative aldouronate transport system substrate-binding protein
MKRLKDNLPVPAENGEADTMMETTHQPGIVDAISITRRPRAILKTYWSTYKAATQTQMKKDWAAKFGAAEPAEWMKKNNKLMVSPNVSVTLPSDPNDIAVYRNACGEVLEEYSWKMIFCGSESKFDALGMKWSSRYRNGYGRTASLTSRNGRSS